jgi:hypothetical protein
MTKSPKLWSHFYWHVFLLGSLIISHPLFKVLSGQSEFLLAHNLEGLDLLYWIFAVGFMVNLLLVLLVCLLTKILPPYTDQARQLVLFILAGIFLFIQFNQWLDSGFVGSAALSILIALVFVRLYVTSIYVRTVLSYTVFLAVLTPILFSLSPGVRQILMPQRAVSNLNIESQANRQPVVIVILDELPVLSLLDSKGNFNAKRFPNLAEFSNTSTWYKYATTTAEATLNSVPPVVTGQLTIPGQQTLPLASNYPVNLFTLLSTSHEVNAFETFTHICPAQLCNPMKPDWRLVAEDTAVIYAHVIAPDVLKGALPPIDNKWVGFLRDYEDPGNIHTDRDLHPHHRYKVRLKKLGWFLSGLESVDPVSVNYLHMLMPHSPWMYLPDGRVYSNAEQHSFTGMVPAGTAGLTINKQLYAEQHLMDFVQQRHLLQAGYTDKLLGDIFSVLRQRNLFDDAVIIVLSDHGVSFRAGDSHREATEGNFQDILSILMMIKYPGQKVPVTDLTAARTSDVLPTILDALNSKSDALTFDGRSLLQNSEAAPPALDLLRDTGEVLQFPFENFRNELERALQNRNKEIFDGGFEDIYKLNGPRLVNQPVQQFTAGGRVAGELILDQPHLYKNVDLTQSTIPTLIRANWSTQAGQPGKSTVAVAVNGIVRAVTTLQHIETVAFDFQALVAPDSFIDGFNSVHFYQVNEQDETFSLSAIPIKSSILVEYGKVYDFSDDLHATPFTGSGWSAESTGHARWNVIETAELAFMVPDPAVGLNLVVDSIPFFVEGKHETQTIIASFPSGHKQVIELQRGATNGTFVIHVKAGEIAPDGSVFIKLGFPNARSPQSMNVSPDVRILAIKVKTIRVLTANDGSD